MVPSESSSFHGPPSLGRVRAPPRSPTSSLLRSPPTPSPHRSRLRFPSSATYLEAEARSSPHRGCLHQRAACRRVVTGSPSHRLCSRREEGLPGCWAVLFVRAASQPPRRVRRCPSPWRSVSTSFLSATSLQPSGLNTPWAPGIRISRLESPRPTRSRVYASAIPSPRSPQDSLPTCWARALVGRASHPLDSEPSFMTSSHTLTPLGPALPGRTLSCGQQRRRGRAGHPRLTPEGYQTTIGTRCWMSASAPCWAACPLEASQE